MACSSGCCGKPASPPPPEQPNSNPASTPDQDDGYSCCDGANTIAGENSDQPGIAGAARDEPIEEDDCCAPKPSAPGCNNKGCCSAPAPAPAPKPSRPEEIHTSSCCEDKPAPCCDQSCLDRLALRECEKYACGLTADSSTISTCGRAKDGKPCAEHANKARLTYAERLEAFGCICRALIALGQESCCLPSRRPPTGSARRRRSKESALRSRTSADSCCVASGADAACCSTKKRPGSRKKNECRSSSDGTEAAAPEPPRIAGSCADSCCAEVRPVSHVNEVKEFLSDVANATTDLEKAFARNEKEHVILSISGMTCTGCETKLVRTLGVHPAVRNLKTSLVLSRAEFDVIGAASVVDVMKHLERTTEFKCERVKNKGSSLDILAPDGDAAAFINRPWPDGVTEVRLVDKKTVNVSFDPKIIGARDLVRHGWADGQVNLAPPRPDLTLEAGSRHVRHVGYMTLLSACLTVPVLVMAWAPLPERDIAYDSASLVLATIVQFVIAGPFYPKALKSFIFSRIIEMDLLIVLSTSTAYIFSVVSFAYLVSGRPLPTGEFFETSTLLVTLIMVGRWVAALARQKAVKSISVRSLQTPTALLVNDDGEETEIDARLLQYGDVFKVVPDSRIPTDGTVVSGSSEADESMITGESRAVEKHAKSPVIAGSVNGSGTLRVRVTRLPGDNTISTIAGMVDEAKLSKPKIQDLADRVASYFVPVVVALTIITLVVWIAIGVAVRQQPGKEATIRAITYAIAVLIVSCPCAIGLAVPMVIVIASGVAAERGVIFKSAVSIEVAHRTSHVILDKTGTITEGKPSVAREWYAEGNQDTTKSLLLGLVGSIKHPVSAAVATHLKTQGVSPSLVSEPKTLTGRGVEGVVEGSGSLLRAGNSRWLNLDSDPEVQSVLSQGYTAFCFTIAGSVAAIFGLQDSIRPDAASTVKTLLERGISVHIISGDDDGAVRSVGAQLGIAETNLRSRCTPSDKQAYIKGLLEGTLSPNQTKKRKKPVVLFCGDGTNDAIALAQATIGVHMNEGGTDVANSAADVVLMRPKLAGILTILAVSEKSTRRIAFNFGWSFVYNLFAILLAAGAFVHARIPPEFAGLGELVSVLPVIAAAVMLRWSKI
ncbi:E1-E2 ATPase-domain-containing protein [Thermothelomyces heterothallicus CBS 202.75]|uniref:E1-E2 ATPase-domain-containing protein n=1 Tax=Thermothelomyces heterothallicus CBS 202.75 TaxID=1149848 RepID=UPI003742C37F